MSKATSMAFEEAAEKAIRAIAAEARKGKPDPDKIYALAVSALVGKDAI